MRNVFEIGEKSENVLNFPQIYNNKCNNVHLTQVYVARQEFFHATEPADRAVKEAALKLAQRLFNEHKNRALLSRRLYYGRRLKATKEENVLKGHLSMIIDGAGAQASNYSPRYQTTEKGEPARHKMLKIKSTYVKVS